MTPKEKAKELFDKMLYHIKYNCQPTLSESVAKQCALIAVDEILDNMMLYQENFDAGKPVHHKSYWQEVKQEITIFSINDYVSYK